MYIEWLKKTQHKWHSTIQTIGLWLSNAIRVNIS